MFKDREKRLEYNKKYNEANKEKAKKKRDANKEKQKEYDKKYNEANKDKRKAQREANKEKNAKQKKEYRKLNIERISARQKRYYESNKDKIKERDKKRISERREYRNKWEKNRREKDPLFKLTKNIRRLINASLKKKEVQKIHRTSKILGCTFQEFKEHIERQFELWMTWENYGSYNPEGLRTWNVDHIIPLSIVKTTEEVIKLNHYTNLRPLCSKENRDKWDKII